MQSNNGSQINLSQVTAFILSDQWGEKFSGMTNWRHLLNLTLISKLTI